MIFGVRVSIAEGKSKDGCEHKIALNDTRSSYGYTLYIYIYMVIRYIYDN